MRILLVAYDNNSYMHSFPLGLAYVASALLEHGHQVEIYNQDVHHYPDEHLTEYLDNNKFDAIGLSFVAGYYTYKKILAISTAINKSRNRPLYILGGHGPTPESEYFLKKTGADAVVMGEGEETIVELLAAIDNNQSLKNVKGIAYRDGQEVIINERRSLIVDINTISMPAYHLFPMNYYRLRKGPKSRQVDFLMNILSGRGCPFECIFCYRMDKGLRIRSNENIIEEIRLLKSEYGINYIAFADEVLMTSTKRAMSLCEDIIKSDLKIRWHCSGRLNFANPALLKVMKKAGCEYISYGIEAIDNNVLRNIKKGLTVKTITKGIEETLKVGISPGLNIIFGNPGDSKETLSKAVNFLLKYDDGADLRTIRPVTPYPGAPLYYSAIEQGLLKGCEDFYENKHVNSDLLTVNFTELSDDEFNQALMEANITLIQNYYKNKCQQGTNIMKKLYQEKDVNFRGFRP